MATKHFIPLLLFFSTVCSFTRIMDMPVKQLGPHSQPHSERQQLQDVFRAQIGVHELTGQNDGHQIEAYLAYCNVPAGHAWCAAFVSWCFGQIGKTQPRNPWSPALFPKARRIPLEKVQTGDLFALYDPKLKRIHHVGFVDEVTGSFIITVEGNSNHAVQSRRRPQSTMYQYANWL